MGNPNYGIHDLNSSKYEVRQAATEDFLSRMPVVIEEIEAATTDNNAEIRLRARSILESYYNLGDNLVSIWNLPNHIRFPDGLYHGRDIAYEYYVKAAKMPHGMAYYEGHWVIFFQTETTSLTATALYISDEMYKGNLARKQAIEFLKRHKDYGVRTDHDWQGYWPPPPFDERKE